MQIHIKKGFLKYSIIEAKSFSERLINWYTGHKRDLPWRQTKDPYKVWLSEIILQQTRVDQGLPYWRRFVETYPTVKDLADAKQEEVLRIWQGLGYYSRARNLHFTAKYVAYDLNGAFPDDYAGLIKLKGVGPYTAAAIASICFNEPTPVVDGNVYRFASRVFGIQDDISKPATRKVFEEALRNLISQEQPGAFNQAMMEHGATICAPSPTCSDCVFQLDCYAFQHKKQKLLPVKTGKTKVRERHFQYAVLKKDDRYYLKERGENDVWNGLYDFFLLEGNEDEESLMAQLNQALSINGATLSDSTEEFVHILSHQKIHARFYSIELSKKLEDKLLKKSGLKLYSIEEVLNLPKPKLIVNYLERIGIT